MVRLTRIYTRRGDNGKTSLGTNVRVLKSSIRIRAIGDVDEANASLGISRLHAEGEIDQILSRIQNDLFDMGADLCTSEDREERESLRIQPTQVSFLEETIDSYNKSLPSLTSFVLPGGSPLSAALHQARAIVRRAERTVCALNETAPTNQYVLHYLNRLSDLLFVLGRYANQEKTGDILWVPGAYR